MTLSSTLRPCLLSSLIRFWSLLHLTHFVRHSISRKFNHLLFSSSCRYVLHLHHIPQSNGYHISSLIFLFPYRICQTPPFVHLCTHRVYRIPLQFPSYLLFTILQLFLETFYMFPFQPLSLSDLTPGPLYVLI